jgi:hypothetical protein
MTEARAREVLKEYDEHHEMFMVYSQAPFVALRAGYPTVTLDGDFTADELEAMAVLMRASE